MDDSPAATARRRRQKSGDSIDQSLAKVSLIEAATRPSAGHPNRSWGRPGKEPAGSFLGAVQSNDADDDMKDSQDDDEDDRVEEYIFSDEEDIDDEDEDDFDDDARSVISLSSSDGSDGGLSDRPWKGLDARRREEWEMMYSNVTSYPMNGSWENTEDFQREKDAEMLRYMEDFPLNQWVIPQEEANKAYFRLLERTRWRSLGIRIYGRERIPEWIPGSTQADRQQQPLNVARTQYPSRQPSVANGGPSRQSSQSGEPPNGGPGGDSARTTSEVALRPGSQTGPPPPQNGGPPNGNSHSSMQPPQGSFQSHPQGPPSQHQSPYPPPQHHQFPNGPPPQHQMQYAMPHPSGPPPPPGQHFPQGHPAHFGPPGHPNGRYLPGHGPPPNQQLPQPNHPLPSQPYAQPMSVPPGQLPHPQHGMGRPIGQPQQMPYGMPPGFAPHMHPGYAPGPGPIPGKHRRGRDKKESPLASTPPPPPPTPPYQLRPKPVDKKAPKPPRRNPSRRQAEAEEFPWTRELNFKELKEKAEWDDSIYDPQTLRVMELTRSRNVPIIEELDAKVQEQQRKYNSQARAAKKDKEKPKKDENVESSDIEQPPKSEKKKMQRGQRKAETGGDPYHSGAFAFASEEDEKKAAEHGCKIPDEALEAGNNGTLDLDVAGTIWICWNPGKKGMTENLEQIKFTVKDTILTRKRLATTPVLTRRAAECVIDFCPDMLWRGMLLRICSEAGYGNKDVRDRFCYNGCYCDKATITKRISAALGQKQVQPKSKGYGPGEWEWYDLNVKDFAKYIDFFGKRTSHRNMLKIQLQSEKRKPGSSVQGENDSTDNDNTNKDGDAGPSSPKRPKLSHDDAGEAGHESDADGEDGHESDGTDDSNAVSLQDSDILNSDKE